MAGFDAPHTPFDVYEIAQITHEASDTSEHPENKAAFTVYGTDRNNQPFQLTEVNQWLAQLPGPHEIGSKIGDASKSMHAETVSLVKAPYTNGASCYSELTPCPNCSKNISEAGIAEVNIAVEGFLNDFYKRRGWYFVNVSLPIFIAAGIDVNIIDRRGKKTFPLYTSPRNFVPSVENKPIIEAVEGDVERYFAASIERLEKQQDGHAFAFAIAADRVDGTYKSIITRTHAYPGFKPSAKESFLQDHHDLYIEKLAGILMECGMAFEGHEHDSPEAPDKYSPMLEPLKCLFMAAAKYGLALDLRHIYSHDCPTSRELVDAIGAGLAHLYIGDPEHSSNAMGLLALEQLTQADVMTYSRHPQPAA